jgi:hypothetical protein
MEEIHQTKRDMETFLMLKGIEEVAAPARLEKIREEVALLEKRERDLQARYAELNDRRRENLAAFEQLEEDKIVLAAQVALEAQEGEVADGDVDMNGA